MSKWNSRYRDRLPASAFLLPKARKLPVRNHMGNISIAHVNNALARLNQVKGITETKRRQLKQELHRLQSAYRVSNPMTSTIDAITATEWTWKKREGGYTMDLNGVICKVERSRSFPYQHEEPGRLYWDVLVKAGKIKKSFTVPDGQIEKVLSQATMTVVLYLASFVSFYGEGILKGKTRSLGYTEQSEIDARHRAALRGVI